MAEQSVILRPMSSSSTTSDVDNGMNVQPTDTTLEDVYLLVNETEADDDATYVELTAVISSFDLYFEKLLMTNISGVKLHCRCDSQGTTHALRAQLTAVPIEGSELNEITSSALNTDPCTTGWANYALDFSDEVTLIEALNNSEYTQIRATCLSGAAPSSSKGSNGVGVVKYTQVYLELTYDNSETTTTPLYLRENGVWVAVEGTVYQKVNGAWVTSSADVFQEGDSYQLVTV